MKKYKLFSIQKKKSVHFFSFVDLYRKVGMAFIFNNPLGYRGILAIYSNTDIYLSLAVIIPHLKLLQQGCISSFTQFSGPEGSTITTTKRYAVTHP